MPQRNPVMPVNPVVIRKMAVQRQSKRMFPGTGATEASYQAIDLELSHSVVVQEKLHRHASMAPIRIEAIRKDL